ncbi:MAG TPA: ribosome maturation factor RimM [Longimicrobiales bacterium]|nr:ribosome maturation factor RimM [Longimicrobiales bacterium]
MQPTHLVVGHITKPHGTKGEVFVWPLTDSIGEVYAPDNELLMGDEHGRLDAEGATLVVESARDFKRGLLVRFHGMQDRNAVQDLGNRYLLVPIDRVAPRAEDEVYYHELLGMQVVTAEGDVVGEVREVYETEPAHLLEVKSNEGKIHLIPFAERIVRQIDHEARKVVIKPPPGLLDL